VSGLAGREICGIDGTAALSDSSQIRTVDSDTWRVLDKTWSIARSTLKALCLIGVMSAELRDDVGTSRLE
jgi:hypothetical protein